MAIATDQQVQQMADARFRVLAERVRDLQEDIDDFIAVLGDVYENLTQETPTFEDSRTDVPVQATPANLLATNALIQDVNTAIKNNANYGTARSLCVRALRS